MKRIAILAVAAMTTFGIACNTDRRNTANDGAVGTSGGADVSRGDRDFVNDVAIANMAEIELGKLAAGRAVNAEVKRFGQMMVDDHTAAGTKLKTVATSHNIPLPTEIDDKHRDLRERLSKLQGAEFDREYMKAMVDGHEDVIDKLESRIDKERLAEYKAKYATPGGRKTDEEIKVDAVMPENSDDRVTMAVNQFAADAYPVVFAHMQKAKTLDETVRKNTTN
jgi:putative membrane protein